MRRYSSLCTYTGPLTARPILIYIVTLVYAETGMLDNCFIISSRSKQHHSGLGVMNKLNCNINNFTVKQLIIIFCVRLFSLFASLGGFLERSSYNSICGIRMNAQRNCVFSAAYERSVNILISASDSCGRC